MVLNNLSIDEELQDCQRILVANACIHCYLNELFLGFFFYNFLLWMLLPTVESDATSIDAKGVNPCLWCRTN